MASKKEKAAYQRQIVAKAKELSDLIGSAAAGNKMSNMEAYRFIVNQKKALRRVEWAVAAAGEMNAL